MATIFAVALVVIIGTFFIMAFTSDKSKKEQPVKHQELTRQAISIKKEPDTTNTFRLKSLIGDYDKVVAKTKKAAIQVNRNTENYKRVIDSLTMLLEPVPNLVTD